MRSVIEFLLDVWDEFLDLLETERNRYQSSRRRAHLCQGCGETSYPLIDFYAMTLHCSLCSHELVWWAL